MVEAAAGERVPLGDHAGVAKLHEREAGKDTRQPDAGDGEGIDGPSFDEIGIVTRAVISDTL